MPKTAPNITETSPFHNLAAADLVDIHGQLGAEIAELEARRKAIAAELLARGVPHVAGDQFESTVVSEAMVATIDREAIERDMGEAWLAKYLKWIRRCASMRTTPLTRTPRNRETEWRDRTSAPLSM
jgi:hypothetical protein